MAIPEPPEPFQIDPREECLYVAKPIDIDGTFKSAGILSAGFDNNIISQGGPRLLIARTAIFGIDSKAGRRVQRITRIVTDNNYGTIYVYGVFA